MHYEELIWEGFSGVRFEFEDTIAMLIRPTGKPNGKWIYKTEYFGVFPAVEKELLRRGYHLLFDKNRNRWGEPYDLERKVRFMSFVPREFGLSERCTMVGMSCGGMYAVKLAALAPDRVDCLYLDAPVINFLSCPFALGRAVDAVSEEYVRLTGRGLPEMLSYREHPLDKFPILAEHKIPVILVAGGSDKIVPFEENGGLLEDYYVRRGVEIEVHIKPDCDHHPHGLDDPRIIADFIEKHS